MRQLDYIILTMIFREEEKGVWTAECKEIGTAGFGDTFEEAQKALEELVGLHLNALEKLGERARFFQANGIRVIKNRPQTATIKESAPLGVLIQREARQLTPA